jgi:hypothetical protein
MLLKMKVGWGEEEEEEELGHGRKQRGGEEVNAATAASYKMSLHRF